MKSLQHIIRKKLNNNNCIFSHSINEKLKIKKYTNTIKELNDMDDVINYLIDKNVLNPSYKESDFNDISLDENASLFELYINHIDYKTLFNDVKFSKSLKFIHDDGITYFEIYTAKAYDERERLIIWYNNNNTTYRLACNKKVKNSIIYLTK